MVELVVCDFDDESVLEYELINNNVEYQISLDVRAYGIKPPYLIVDGVPLDNYRAIKWIEEKYSK